MSIRVVRYEHQSGVLDDDRDEITLLFDPRVERGLERIGDRFRKLDVGARSADSIVVRGSSPELLALTDEDSMFRRLVGSRPVAVLAPVTLGGRPEIQAVSWSAAMPADESVESRLCEAELVTGLRAQNAIFKAEGCHYVLPNASYHADAFVRLENGLQDHTDLLRLTDWLAYRVDERTALAADNGSLLALLTVVAGSARDRLGLGEPPPIATLNEYPLGPTAIATAVERFSALGWSRLLFLVSVNSSGRIADEVGALAEVETEVVALCETRHSRPAESPESFATVPVERWKINPDGRCDTCPERHLLAIDPRTYEIRPRIRLKAIGPDTPHAISNREFWEAADRTDAVSLHVDARMAAGAATPSRHLSVGLDVARLLGDLTFREESLTVLRSIARAPDIVVIPDHGCADALKALVAGAFSALDESRIFVCQIGGVADQVSSVISDCRHALIVDDTLVSSSTLVALHAELYALFQTGDGGDIAAFVPLSRPASAEDHAHARRRLTQAPQAGEDRPQEGFYFTKKLLLPDGKDCPWCAERALIEGRLDALTGTAREFASARREHLSRPVQPPLLPCGDDPEGDTRGSFFGDLGPAAAFAAVSALAQHMHSEMEKGRRDETIEVLDVPLVLHAFFDPIIVAGSLRTFPARDLRDPAAEHVVARTILENARTYPNATIAELALAAASGKLPPGPVEELLKSRQGDWARMMEGLLTGF